MQQVFNVMIRDQEGKEFSILVTTDRSEAEELFMDVDRLEAHGAIAAALLVDGEVEQEAEKVPEILH